MGGYRRDRDGSQRRVEIPRHSAGICHSDGRYSRGRITSRRTHLMPSYEATPAELDKYGANLNIWQQIQLLSAWSPLIGYGQRLVNEIDPYKKSIIVGEACEWLAAKTKSVADDQLVRLLSDVLRTKEGESLVRFLVLQVEGRK